MSDYLFEAIVLEKNIKLLVESAGEGLGYYLYVIDNNTQRNIADHLCDNMNEVFQVANEDFGLNPDDFRELKEK
jgi:S-ribosylhomocysteine lyase LuxS involved in autoinducer biosynthesis